MHFSPLRAIIMAAEDFRYDTLAAPQSKPASFRRHHNAGITVMGLPAVY